MRRTSHVQEVGDVLAALAFAYLLPGVAASRAHRSGRLRGWETHPNTSEAWISADPFKRGFRVLITGSHGFERSVMFALDDDPGVIGVRIRETLKE
jgi:hypothetical protein